MMKHSHRVHTRTHPAWLFFSRPPFRFRRGILRRGGSNFIPQSSMGVAKAHTQAHTDRLSLLH